MAPDELQRESFATICVYGAGEVDSQTGAVSFPIYQRSTFAFKSAQEGTDIFAGRKEGYLDTRLGNPTQAAF